ncbi:RusA family crossover junction endodeoxyribonuclease [Herbaspirillum chlorophenolicum]|uniref:RusA family crossover junction endodeoxyribonuclease n=1 Tax=Herbaspirillum chlorophenolicum TaxID=211589 RepID=UPI00067AB575|nr:RusA family crossover junction endodeoxyribonuclease [Herbaspirillum chlorophenolicum]
MKPITLTLPYPVSANAYWATRIIPAKAGRPAMAITYVTKEAEAYKQAVGWKCKAAGLREPITGRVQIDVQLYPARPQDWQKRQRQAGATWDDTVRCIDLDNANKVLLDALKGVAMDDDKWVRRMVAERMEPDAEGARVVVTITPLGVEQRQVGLFGEAA